MDLLVRQTKKILQQTQERNQKKTTKPRHNYIEKTGRLQKHQKTIRKQPMMPNKHPFLSRLLVGCLSTTETPTSALWRKQVPANCICYFLNGHILLGFCFEGLSFAFGVFWFVWGTNLKHPTSRRSTPAEGSG